MTLSRIPERIARLEELAYNLWWSWHEQARKLFRAVDYPLWRVSGHNPVKQLREVAPEKLEALAADADFLKLYDSVVAAFDADISPGDHSWLAVNHPDLVEGTVAYFSMEYAIHSSLPIYAGGLGALAGDTCKEASDLGLPLVAVGFMYPHGYFHQHITAEGWQEEIYQQLSFEEAPISRVFSPDGGKVIARVRCNDIELALGVWLVRVGRTCVYLLDTDIEENPPHCRHLSARLYIADREQRLQQEIVLGIGGVRVLRALGIHPSIWHANEGHTAFMMLERARELVAGGTDFAGAADRVRKTTTFTTHTPVMAGHDVFSPELVERYFRHYWASLSIDRDGFYRLGQYDGTAPQGFNMTVLALNMAEHRSAVSQLHEGVTRNMWQRLWPEASEDQIPISSVTNGIHVPSWVAPELSSLLDRYLGKDWMREHDDARLWEKIMDIPGQELWAVCQKLRRKLVGAIRERMRRRWMEDGLTWPQMMAMGSLLDPEVLTVAYARRFAEYKRPALIFHDVERLKRIVTNPWHPVQIVFAGKSHPADLPSKVLLKQVYSQAAAPEFQGRIVFVEDYDLHMARYLVQGVDVWLNVPSRLQEACGTSGMKAALNGVLQFSVLDGWWHEGYNGRNGWAVGNETVMDGRAEEDATDAESIYEQLKEAIVPLYYRRDVNGIPQDWVHMMKESMRTLAPAFSARRMLKEYVERMYLRAAGDMKGV